MQSDLDSLNAAHEDLLSELNQGVSDGSQAATDCGQIRQGACIFDNVTDQSG